MPLIKGSSKEVIQENIKKLIDEGYSPEQAAAIAYSNAQSDTMDRSDRIFDSNGFFEIKKNPITKVGVFPYLGSSIGAPEPNRFYNVYRPEEELNNTETIESFRLLPIIDEHEMLGENATPAEHKGIHGVSGEDVSFSDNTLYSNLKFYSESIKNVIESGKRDISIGYRCVYEFAQGEYNGVKYEAIQRKIRGNHIAIVDDGRSGKEIAVLDEAEKSTEVKMEEETKVPEQTPAQDEVTIESLAQEIATLKEGHSALLAKIDELLNMEKEESKEETAEETPAPVMDADEIRKAVKEEMIQISELYDELSPVVGAFDHAEMSLSDMAKYGVGKLELSAQDGAELPTLKGYLAGIKKEVSKDATDSKEVSEVDNYLKGKQ